MQRMSRRVLQTLEIGYTSSAERASEEQSQPGITSVAPAAACKRDKQEQQQNQLQPLNGPTQPITTRCANKQYVEMQREKQPSLNDNKMA